ncbi:MAG TPA: hypothetical protein VLX85_11810 [Stellaceae bacterium]|nr:hypothetical protein [Stellaceae bacterium]
MDQINFELDHGARILTIHVVGEIPDRRALRDIPQIWKDHPEVRDYDSVIDLTHDQGAITWDAISQIADEWHAFAGAADATRRTAVVVRSTIWKPIVTAIAARFPNRRFDAFRTDEDARKWIIANSASRGTTDTA